MTTGTPIPPLAPNGWMTLNRVDIPSPYTFPFQVYPISTIPSMVA